VKFREHVLPFVVSGLLGLLLFRWEHLASAVGWQIHIERGNSMVTFEYPLGFAVVLLLGYIFASYAIECAISFMFVPIVISHTIYIWQHGVPRMWVVELMFLAGLTVPYIALAYGAAYLRRRWDRKRGSVA